MKAILGGVLAASLFASPTFAQSSSGTWNGLGRPLPDRHRLLPASAPTPCSATTAHRAPATSTSRRTSASTSTRTRSGWTATWRVGRRHQLKLAYTRLSRDRADYTLAARLHLGRRDLQRRALGDHVDRHRHPRRATTASPLVPQRALRDRPDDRRRLPLAERAASRRRARSRRRRGRTLDESASTGSVTGAVGGYASAWLTKRLVARGGLPLHQGVAGRLGGVGHRLAARGGLLLLPQRGPGRSVQVQHSTATTAASWSSQLGGEITYKGFQVFLSFLF